MGGFDTSGGRVRLRRPGAVLSGKGPDVRITVALVAIRAIHQREEFGDCVEDGEVYPCKTIRVLDWLVSDAAS